MLLHVFLTTVLSIALLVLIVFVVAVGICRVRANRFRATQQQQQSSYDKRKNKIVAFFHPYCTGGGGGERVLWKCIHVLGEMMEHDSDRLTTVVIYTIDSPSPRYTANVLQHVQERFSIGLSDKLKLHFVHLHEYKYLLDPAPRLSLVMESLGAMRLAWRGLQISRAQRLLPHVFIDTTGCAGTFLPATCIFGCRVVAYVHYPTISTDMLNMVWERRRAAYNHSSEIADSRVKTAVKLLYYCAFAIWYGIMGSCATLVMVNSTWTANHVRFLWKGPAWRKAITIVYPPCAVEDVQQQQSIGKNDKNSNTAKLRLPIILSIGQFRPEKDHVLQIEAFARLLHQSSSNDFAGTRPKLVLLGSCRHEDDHARLAHLQQLVQELSLPADSVEFCVNQPYSVVQHWLGQASVGIHTMWNEHFGIGIVEMMAAGLLVVAHNSGGPRSDIIAPGETGFLAATVDEYAVALHTALTLPAEQASCMRKAARESSKRFSDEVFAQSFREAMEKAKIL